MKICPACDTAKPLGEFYDGSGWCKRCQNSRPKPQTARRIIRTRARHRARAELVELHRDEYDDLVEFFIDVVTEEAQRLAQQPEAAEHYPDDEPVRLRPGRRLPDETPLDRIDVARCPECADHHDRGHRCRACGAAPITTRSAS